MNGKKGSFEQVKTKLPHWLAKDDYTERERESILRSYLILKVLAKHGPLSKYGIRERIKQDESKNIPYPRILAYVEKLRRRGLIHRIKGQAKRNAKVYVVTNEVIGDLYYHHFLSEGEVLQIVERQSHLMSLFKELGMSKEIREEVESHLSATMLQSLVYLHSPHRVYDVSEDFIKDFNYHVAGTTLRDIDTGLLLRLLVKLGQDGDLLERFEQHITSYPNLLPLLRNSLSQFLEFRKRIQEYLSALDRANELLRIL